MSSLLYSQVPEGIITESGTTVEPTDTTAVTTESDFMNDIVNRTITRKSRLLPYDNPREADVPWSKVVWRIIDTRQKLNLPFGYRKMPLVNILLEGIKKGGIVAFMTDDFKNTLTHEDIISRLNLIDTVPVMDLETQTETWEVVHNEFNPEAIKRYRVKEVWYFDDETSRVRVRVLGISPVRNIYNQETGILLRQQPMFWINFNQARKYLNNYTVFNGFNDSSFMTWSDIFDSRKFASFIYKTTNVRDNRLDILYKDNPIEMLYRSREIETALFNFEQDLWSY